MERLRIGIVIPALNEAETIVNIVKSVAEYGMPIVVNDGSTDNTAELSINAGAVVVSHEKNQGYDTALNSGFKKACELGCEIVITIDADGQHNPSLIQQFVAAVDAGADLVVGVRSHKQRFAEHLFACYTNFRFGIKDPLCGMKAYRTIIYKELGFFDSYGSVGTELMIFASKHHYRLDQVEIEIRDRAGKSRFGQAFWGNYKIIRAMILSIWRVK